MARRTPGVQARSQYHPYWGIYSTPNDLPNMPGGIPPFIDLNLLADLEPGDTAFVQTASVTATAAAETNVLSAGVGMLNFPANFFAPGRSIQISASGFYSLDTLGGVRVRVKLGATTLLDTGMVVNPTGAPFVNELFSIEANITCRTTGAPGTVFAQGSFQKQGPTSAVLSAQMVNTATTAITTTGTLALTVTVEFNAVAAGNTLTLTNLAVIG